MRKMAMKYLLCLGLVVFAPLTSAHEVREDNSWWWSEAWWNEGKIEVPQNHDLIVSWESYQSGDVEVPVMVVRPKE